MAIAEEEQIFNAAVQIPSGDPRRLYLEQACGDDTELRSRVEAFLRVHDENKTFLKNPADSRRSAFDAQLGPGPDSVIGPYKLIEQIGEGGMGTVFLAEQSEPLHRRVALKIIKPGMDSRHVVARFEAERQALAVMDHPNIAKVFDAGATAMGRPYFVMELIQGVPITTYCDEHHLTPKERLELFIPVCQAVQHAHQKGIIHRDLKPSNVMITLRDGKPVTKIIDFGVAKAMSQKLTESTLFTGLGNVVGTLAYMSPEQAEPNQNDIDTRSDIYSLGVLMYELLTGTTPFDRSRYREAAWAEMLRMLREEEPPKPSTRLSHVEELPSIAANRGLEPKKLSGLMRGDLDWIVMKSLEKDRTRRYATANGLARDIERYLNEEPVEAGPPGAAYRLRKFARKHRVSLATAGAIALLVVAGAGISIWQAVRATAAERTAKEGWDNAIAQKARADQEAAIAIAVNEFLQQDLLEQADIGKQAIGTERNRNITVRDLLDRAAKDIETKFVKQPRTEAAIRQTVGAAYRALGEYAEAEKHLQRAVELCNAEWGARHAEALGCTKRLADAYSAHGNYGEAERLYKHVLDVRRADLGDDDLATLGSMTELGLLYVARARYKDAEALLEPAMRGQSALLGTDHIRTLECMHGLAVLNFALRRYERAGALFRQTYDGFRNQFGPDHPSTLASAGSLGAAYMSLRQYKEAETILNEVLMAKRAKLGADNPDTFNTMQNLAQVYQELKRFDEAEAMYKKTLEGRLARQGPDHRDTLRTKQNFATYLVDRGRFDQAESLYLEVLAVQRAKLGPEHHEAIVVLHNLGILYRRLTQYDESEKYFIDALNAARKTLTLNHSDTRDIIANFAMVHYLRGTPDRAESVLRELVTFLDAQPERDSLAVANGLSVLALNLLAQKQYVEAEGIAKRCVELRAKIAPDRWHTFFAQSMLGGALAGQKKFADAEPLLVQGYEGMKQREATIGDLNKVHLSDAHSRLIQLYEDWGKPADAEKWRKLLPAAQPEKK